MLKFKEEMRTVLEKIGITRKSRTFGRIMERIGALGQRDINLIYSILKKLSPRLD